MTSKKDKIASNEYPYIAKFGPIKIEVIRIAIETGAKIITQRLNFQYPKPRIKDIIQKIKVPFKMVDAALASPVLPEPPIAPNDTVINIAGPTKKGEIINNAPKNLKIMVRIIGSFLTFSTG